MTVKVDTRIVINEVNYRVSAIVCELDDMTKKLEPILSLQQLDIATVMAKYSVVTLPCWTLCQFVDEGKAHVFNHEPVRGMQINT